MCYNFILFSLLMAVLLASINVNSAAERHKRLKVFGCLRAMPVDLFLLQETHLADFTQGKAWEKDWGGQCTWSPGSNRSADVVVLIHPNSAAKLVDSKTDLAGRVVTALIIFTGNVFKLLMFTGLITTANANYFLTISGVLNTRTSNLLLSEILTVYRTSRLTSGEAMTVLETGLSRSYTLSQHH